MRVALRTNFASRLNRFDVASELKKFIPVALPPGLARLATNPKFDRVIASTEHNRDSRRRHLRRKRLSTIDRHDNDRRLTANQLSHQFRKACKFTLNPNVFNCDVAALDVPGFAKAGAEGWQISAIPFKRSCRYEPDNRQRRLLRAGCEGPRRRPTKPRDELPPLHTASQVEVHICNRNDTTRRPRCKHARKATKRDKVAPSSRRVLECIPGTAAAAARLSSWSMPRRSAASTQETPSHHRAQ